MAAIPRGLDDLILDAIVARLNVVASAEEAEDPALGWTTTRNKSRPWEAAELRTGPLVNCWIPNVDPVREGSSSRRLSMFEAQYHIECYTRGVETVGGPTADQDAADRLVHLKQQVAYGLFDMAWTNWGLATTGVIGKFDWPRWETLQNEQYQMEDQIIAGRWRLSIQYVWEPADIDLPDLEALGVTDTDRFAALYDYTG
ncbi:MAG: hypothetical protein ACOC2N_00055 [Spirochaetota bacterium]